MRQITIGMNIYDVEKNSWIWAKLASPDTRNDRYEITYIENGNIAAELERYKKALEFVTPKLSDSDAEEVDRIIHGNTPRGSEG